MILTIPHCYRPPGRGNRWQGSGYIDVLRSAVSTSEQVQTIQVSLCKWRRRRRIFPVLPRNPCDSVCEDLGYRPANLPSHCSAEGGRRNRFRRSKHDKGPAPNRRPNSAKWTPQKTTRTSSCRSCLSSSSPLSTTVLQHCFGSQMQMDRAGLAFAHACV